MFKLLTLVFLCAFTTIVNAQSPPITTPLTEEFGKVNQADLELKSCDFEKDANAMVLFDKAEVVTGIGVTTVIHHKRIKIFNASGYEKANIILSYYSNDGLEKVSDVMAETINLENNAAVFTKVENKLIYNEAIDKNYKRIVFSFPGVKAGSIVEYRYKIAIASGGSFPGWVYQQDIPVKYSELKASISNDYYYKMTPKINQDYSVNSVELWMKSGHVIGKKYTWALSNIVSFREEPYSAGKADNLQRIDFFLSAIAYIPDGRLTSIEKTWQQVGTGYNNAGYFGAHLKEKLSDKELLEKAKLLSSVDESVSYVFNEIKSKVKWNGENEVYINNRLSDVWTKKSGNSSEINLVLYRFLQEAGIDCSPLLVRTRETGKLNTDFPDERQFNKTVIRVSAGPNKTYILDLSDKNNTYTNIPFDILNTNALLIDPVTNFTEIVYLKSEKPSKEEVVITGQISPKGQIEGVALVTSFDYIKINKLSLFDKLGEIKYANELKHENNIITINSFRRENVAADTLPLMEKIDFKLDLADSDDSYIYFNPNLFTAFNINPFLSETRISSVYFGFLKSYSITGNYKIPERYKIDMLPKNVLFQTSDGSMVFNRIVTTQAGSVIVHFIIDYKKAIFSTKEYPDIRNFYKKMHEMLNEQIVLKKL